MPETTEPATTEPRRPRRPRRPTRYPRSCPIAASWIVVAANGANVAGRSARAWRRGSKSSATSTSLPLNGTDIVEFTVVYYADGFEEAALRLAEDLDLLPEFVAPIDDAPAVVDLPADVELLVYVGLDRA